VTVTTNGRRISRDDLEAAYTKVLGETNTTAKSAANQIAGVAVAGAVVVAAVFYLMGRRRGRRQSALIVRRV
jgi:hypothetical protein